MNTPFKVMCVAELEPFHIPDWAEGRGFNMPVVGEAYTVIEVNEDKKVNIVFYTLAERPYEDEHDARAFATLPEQSADEINESEKESIVNLEHA